MPIWSGRAGRRRSHPRLKPARRSLRLRPQIMPARSVMAGKGMWRRRLSPLPWRRPSKRFGCEKDLLLVPLLFKAVFNAGQSDGAEDCPGHGEVPVSPKRISLDPGCRFLFQREPQLRDARRSLQSVLQLSTITFDQGDATCVDSAVRGLQRSS